MLPLNCTCKCLVLRALLRMAVKPGADGVRLRMIRLPLQDLAVIFAGQRVIVSLFGVKGGQSKMSPGFVRILIEKLFEFLGRVLEKLSSHESKSEMISSLAGCRIYGQCQLISGQCFRQL